MPLTRVSLRRGALTFTIALLTFAAGASPSDDLAANVEARLQELGVTPAALDPIAENALRVRRAISTGDFATADAIVRDVLASSQIENWRFHPWAEFVDAVLQRPPPEFDYRLDEWVTEEESNTGALLLRAKYLYERGWERRGHGFAADTSQAAMDAFVTDIYAAYDDADRAMSLDPANPYGAHLRLLIIGTTGSSPAFDDGFADAVARFPDYYQLYETKLKALQLRWGGTTEAMRAFVAEYAGKASSKSPLKMLYLTYFRDLLYEVSGIICRSAPDDEKGQCIATAMNENASPDISRHIEEALSLADNTDTYQFGLKIKEIISDMLVVRGGETYAATLLQLAATSLHSNTQLKQEMPGQNNYVIDELLAKSWATQGFHENEMTKYDDALADIQNFEFPSEEARNSALASVYLSMSAAAEGQQDYVDEVVYAKAAVLLGLPWHEHHVCYGYYQLKAYDLAIEACTGAIANTDNHDAWYWRGSAHNALGQQDLALSDLKQAADFAEHYSDSAAIDMSMIYFNRGDNSSALAVLNDYPFLYDAGRTNRANVAVAYNNRCYAYMELGDLEKALADCTQSLSYGNLPDAIRKQQELVALLRPTN